MDDPPPNRLTTLPKQPNKKPKSAIPSRAVAALALATTTACSGPLGPFAGGTLSGPSAEPPEQWNAIPDSIQLEVRPSAPYSVNLWCVAIGPHLYVATGPDGSTWTTHLQTNRNVRVRVNGTIYELQATTVTDANERQRAVDAYRAKYANPEETNGFAPIRNRRRTAMNAALDESGQLFRLQPRLDGH